jgi:hypothetical protein
MTKRFETINALTDFIMDEISYRVPGSEIGISARSVSRYVERNERRVRISDHDATGSCGGGIVYEIDIRDFNLEEIYDECGEWDGLDVHHDWKIEEAISAAVEALTA